MSKQVETAIATLKKLLRAPMSEEALLAFSDSLLKESDRACIILLASVTHESINGLMSERMPNLNSDVRQRLFNSDRAFSSFSISIDITYALGWITKNQQTALRILKEMRNACAHSVREFSFATPEIADLATLFIKNAQSENETKNLFGNLNAPTLRKVFLMYAIFLLLDILLDFAKSNENILGQLRKAVIQKYGSWPEKLL